MCIFNNLRCSHEEVVPVTVLMKGGIKKSLHYYVLTSLVVSKRHWGSGDLSVFLLKCHVLFY